VPVTASTRLSAESAVLDIGQMQPDEASIVADLFQTIVSVLPYYNDCAKESELKQYSADRLRESVDRDSDAVLVARTNGAIVGFCISRLDDGLVWLSWFGVHPTQRGKGVGSALLDGLEASVANGRSHKIWCDCRTDNELSIRMLTRHRYSRLCEVANHWYGQDFILWEKLVK